MKNGAQDFGKRQDIWDFSLKKKFCQSVRNSYRVIRLSTLFASLRIDFRLLLTFRFPQRFKTLLIERFNRITCQDDIYCYHSLGLVRNCGDH